jgi:hypothetical protein
MEANSFTWEFVMALLQIAHEPFVRARERIAQRRVELEDQFRRREEELSAKFEKDKTALEEMRSAALRELAAHESAIAAAESSMEALDALDEPTTQTDPAASLSNGAMTAQPMVPRPAPRTQREIVLEAVRRLNRDRGTARWEIEIFALQQYGKNIPSGNITTYLGQLRDKGLVRYVDNLWIPTGGWITE